MATVLVVGGTGILAPAVRLLLASGAEVDVLTRGSRTLPVGARGRVADARDASALETALGRSIWPEAVVYGPAASDATLATLRSHVSGRCVLVRTSSAAAPERGEQELPQDTLQLGWVPASDGDPARWHTADEVSRAAIAVLEDGRSRVLGSVRPWSERPD